MTEGYPVNDPSEDILLMQIERCEEARAAQDAELLALREGLKVMMRSMAGSYAADFRNRAKYPSHNDAMGLAHKALTDSAPAAREIEQRIAAEAVKPWQTLVVALIAAAGPRKSDYKASNPTYRVPTDTVDALRTLLKASESKS